jgi:hypothetical protein
LGHIKPAFGQQFLHVAVAQGEAEIEPDRVLDDLGREAMTAVAEPSHLDILPDTPASRPGFRDVTVPPRRFPSPATNQVRARNDGTEPFRLGGPVHRLGIETLIHSRRLGHGEGKLEVIG